MTTLREKLKEVYYKEFDKDGYVAVDTTFENVLSFISSECERARGEAVKGIEKFRTQLELAGIQEQPGSESRRRYEKLDKQLLALLASLTRTKL